jgi:hypothetical protein
MKESFQDTSFEKTIWKSRNVSKYLLRLIYRTVLISVLAAILGYGFMFIAQGIILCSLAWAPIWRPAFCLVARLISLEEPDIAFTAQKLRCWQVIYWVFRGAIRGALFIGGGVWILLQNGFCNQNILWRILK